MKPANSSSNNDDEVVKETKNVLNGVENKIKKLKQSLAYERARAAKLEDRCKDYEVKEIELRNDIKNKESVMESFRGIMDTLKMKLKASENDLVAFQQEKIGELCEAELKVKHKEQRIAILEHEITHLNAQKQRLNEIVSGKDEEISGLREALREARKSRDHYYVQAQGIFGDGDGKASKKRKFGDI